MDYASQPLETLPTRHRAAVLAQHGRFSIAPVIAIAAAAAIVGATPAT